MNFVRKTQPDILAPILKLCQPLDDIPFDLDDNETQMHRHEA